MEASNTGDLYVLPELGFQLICLSLVASEVLDGSRVDISEALRTCAVEPQGLQLLLLRQLEIHTTQICAVFARHQ